uniref:Proline rich 15 n=1 Tax=Ornithorhynchus anatinus TaxID=9258 RepID=F7ELR5_ORNAN
LPQRLEQCLARTLLNELSFPGPGVTERAFPGNEAAGRGTRCTHLEGSVCQPFCSGVGGALNPRLALPFPPAHGGLGAAFGASGKLRAPPRPAGGESSSCTWRLPSSPWPRSDRREAASPPSNPRDVEGKTPSRPVQGSASGRRRTGQRRGQRPRTPGEDQAMADGGGGGGGGSSLAGGPSNAWWKSLTNSRKKSKEGSEGPPPTPGEPTPSQDRPACPRENQHPNFIGGGDPHRPDKGSADKPAGSRRNLKISRSGRFKEKRKVRATLLTDGPDEVEPPVAPREERP